MRNMIIVEGQALARASGLMHECIAHLCVTHCHLSKGLCKPYSSPL